MTIVEQTAGRLVLRERPWLAWLVGGLFLAAGTGVAIASDERLFGAGFAVAGAVLILAFANTVTATFNRDTGRFTRSVTGLVRNSLAIHSISDITSVGVEASRSGTPSRAHRLVLTLSSGASVPLTTSYSSGLNDKERTAGVIRQFLGLQAPDAPLPGFGEMIGMLFDPDAARRLADTYGQRLAAEREAAARQGDTARAAEIDEMLKRLSDAAGGPS